MPPVVISDEALERYILRFVRLAGGRVPIDALLLALIVKFGITPLGSQNLVTPKNRNIIFWFDLNPIVAIAIRRLVHAGKLIAVPASAEEYAHRQVTPEEGVAVGDWNAFDENPTAPTWYPIALKAA